MVRVARLLISKYKKVDFKGLVDRKFAQDEKLTARSKVISYPGPHLLVVLKSPDPMALDSMSKYISKFCNELYVPVVHRIVPPKESNRICTTYHKLEEKDQNYYLQYDYNEYYRYLGLGNIKYEHVDLIMEFVMSNTLPSVNVEFRRDSWFSYHAERSNIEIMRPFSELYQKNKYVVDTDHRLGKMTSKYTAK